jgi:hypothetical protein
MPVVYRSLSVSALTSSRASQYLSSEITIHNSYYQPPVRMNCP